MSSDEHNSPPSSPLCPSSPVQPEPKSSPPQENPPSSPVVRYESSPDEVSSDDDYQPPRKKFSEPGVSRLDLFWPPTKHGSSDSEQMHDDELGHHDNGSEQVGSSERSQCSSEHSTSIAVTSEEDTSGSESSEDEDSESVHSTSDESSSDSSEDSGRSSGTEDSEGSARSEGRDTDELVNIWEGSDLTVDEGVLSLMDLFVEHSITKVAMGAFLNTLIKFLPESHTMPKTPYHLMKYVTSLCPLPQEVVHFYCAKCLYYLGKTAQECNSCNSNISKKFFQLSMEHQIRNLFENQNLADRIDEYAMKIVSNSQSETLMDICDGSEYKRMRVPGQYNLSLIGHTDGVSVSKSSNVSLWPLEYFICELPPHLRFKFLLVNGVWLDDSKPNFNVFYGPFADEAAKLQKDGISWVHPKTGITHKSIISVMGFVADGPVRAQIQNILSIGGRFSCNTCEQKMLKLPREPVLPGIRKLKRKRIFAFSEHPCKLRSSDRMKAQGEKTLRLRAANMGAKVEPVKGVFGPSVVCKLAEFDTSSGVFAEYMHLVLGIVKQFLELFFESKKELPYSLRAHRDAVNLSLLSIRVPDFISRIPRSTDCYSKWKANELRSFLLYYSVILLSPFMKEAYLKHWMLFVSSMEILLRDKIAENDIVKAETMLRLFIRNFAALYDAKALTYNLHNLLHLSLTVRRWGNLQYVSAFQFENFNGSLVKCIHGSKNQGKELINNIRIICGIGALRARVGMANVSRNSIPVLLRNKISNYCVSHEEQQLLDDLGKSPSSYFYRALVNNKDWYTSCTYQRQVKRNNYTICFKSSFGQIKYGLIKCFLNCGGDLLAFIHPFDVDHLKYFMHEQMSVILSHIVPIRESENVELVPVVNFVSKVIRVDQFVCLRPNSYEENL